ncbi:hypothetical protein L6259_01135 [Candidatus Parcubacteria bacterium]|nr:hypothetical protein [Candidatus Parcubacteria bacterium]
MWGKEDTSKKTYILYFAHISRQSPEDPLVSLRDVGFIASCEARSMEGAIKKFKVKAIGLKSFLRIFRNDSSSCITGTDPFEILRVELPKEMPNWYEGEFLHEFLHWLAVSRVTPPPLAERERWFIVERIPNRA